MIERFLVKFKNGETCCKTLDRAQDIARFYDGEIFHMTDYCPEIYRYAKFIPKITHEIGELMAEVDDLRVKNGSSPKYGTVESV